MQLEPFVESILSQALVGSRNLSFDSSLFPKDIQGAVGNVLEQSTDDAAKLLQVVSIVDGYLCTNETVPLNSISLKDSLTYFSLKASPDLLKGKAKKAKGATSSTPSLEPAEIERLQSLKDRVEQFEGPQPILPWLSPNEIAVVAQVNSLHTEVSGDTGLKYMPSTRLLPELPAEIFQLFAAVQKENNPALVYYFLRKLSACPLRFATCSVSQLLDLIMANGELNRNCNIGYLQTLFSPYMLQELLLKVGGAPLQFLASICLDSKNKAILGVLDQLNLQDQDLLNQQGQPRLVLTPATPEAAADASTLAAVESCFKPSGDLDYAALLKTVTPAQSVGILILLRWTQPDLARELIGQKLLKAKPQAWLELLSILNINRSLQDEDWLMQLFNDPDQEHLKKPSKTKQTPAAATLDNSDIIDQKGAIAGRLIGINSPQYSKLCLEVCSKYLQFCGTEQEGQYWQIVDVTNFKHGPEFEALGISAYKYEMTQQQVVRWLISFLLMALTWEDMCILAKADTPQQAFQHWALFEKSILSPKEDLVPKARDFKVLSTLCDKIAGTQDPELAEAFLQAIDTTFADVLDRAYQYHVNLAIAENLLMILPVEQRCAWLKSHPSCAPKLSWLVESGSNPYDFPELSPDWSMAVMQQLVECVDADIFISPLESLKIMLPCFFSDATSLDWCEQKLKSMKQQIDELTAASKQAGKKAKEQRADPNTLTKQVNEAFFVKTLLKYIKLKREIDQAMLSLPTK